MEALILLIVIVFGKVIFTICCDCQVHNWSWRQCGSNEINTEKINFTVGMHVTDDCNGVALNVTTDNKLGPITSAQVEVEGSVHGVPVVSFSDPNACSYKKPPPGEHGASSLREAFPLLCSKMTESFNIVLPLTEEEIAIFRAVTGDFEIKIWYKNINNVLGLSGCYECSGTFLCSEEDSEEN